MNFWNSLSVWHPLSLALPSGLQVLQLSLSLISASSAQQITLLWSDSRSLHYSWDIVPKQRFQVIRNQSGASCCPLPESSCLINFSIFLVVYGRKTRLISLNHGWKICFYSILIYELYPYSSIFVLVDIRFWCVQVVTNTNDALMSILVPSNGIAGL